MNTTEQGMRLFHSINPDQMGSINLVLASLAGGPRELGPLIRDLLMHSGISGRLPNPRDCVRFAADVGIIHETYGGILLTDLGEELLTISSWPPYNRLNEAQGLRLLSKLIQQTDFAVPLTRLLRKMRRRSDGSLEIIPRTILLLHDENQCLHALQSMHAIQYSNGVLIMLSRIYENLVDLLGPSAVLTEAELLRILELQRLRGVAAEEYVKEMEIERLNTGGRTDLAGLVERIAIRNVAAGYDIRSFELDGSDRFIEVKSSTGISVRFIVSRNELDFLELHNSTAWIYFIPEVHELPYLTHPVVAIPNPLKWIRYSGSIEAHEFLIEMPESISRSMPVENGVVWLRRREDE